jgi:magnesium transporter
VTDRPEDTATVEPEGEAEPVSGLTREYIDSIVEALGKDDPTPARELAEPLHYSELADLLETVDAEKRAMLIDLLRDSFDPVVLTELDETVREQVIEQLGMPHVAEAVAEMDSDDQLFLLGELEPHERDEVIASLPAGERSLIREGLAYPEYSAGRLMQREVVALPEQQTVGEAIDFLRDAEDLPSDFYDVILVDPRHHPVGAVPLSRVLAARRPTPLMDLVIRDMKTIPVDMDQEEVAFLFRQRDLISAPVVDAGGRLVGVITIDDIVDVIDEEHEEDIKLLAGVGEGDTLFTAVIGTVRSRFLWLAVHLMAAFVAASVISMFRGEIQEIVALAILMPIVAAMGGTASVQALTVAVRAIAMKELSASNALRNVGKEVAVGFLNGTMFAAIIGVIAWIWFGSPALGGVIGLAIVINLVTAGLAGSVLPVMLQRLGFDPAVASSAFLTAITDVVGFYAFLGLGAFLLL